MIPRLKRPAIDQYELQNVSQRSLLSTHANRDIDNNIRHKSKSPPLRYTSLLLSLGILVTTVISVLLLIASATRWTFTTSSYRTITQNRASVQLVIQILSNAFALIWVSIVCTLINCASRTYFGANPVELNTLRFWHSLCSRTVLWSLPLEFLLVLLLFIGLTAVPSALWAGALTPVVTTNQQSGSLLLPAYRKSSDIIEWPSEIDKTGPSLRSPLGFFTYSVGVQMQGSLLASASAATPVDGSVRQHQKLDYTGFNYYGRSYGIGAAVGLTDSPIISQQLAQNYSYVETGYKTAVSCIHNDTADFRLYDYNGDALYVARGELPNSTPGDPESSVYVGHGTSAIVAIGVGRNWESPSRMLGIAAGDSYAHLDKMQCTLDFKPTVFNVSVGISQRNVTVTPLEQEVTNNPVNDARNLTHVVTRQFELITNDQTNLYVSLVGNSLNASIGDYVTVQNYSSANNDTLRRATPVGLSNALEAMVDDILGAYASAQIMIAGQTRPQNATVTSSALRVGEDVYIRAVFGINVVVIFLVFAETVRTRAWRRAGGFDYMDPSDLVLATMQAQTNNQHRYDSAALQTNLKSGQVKVALDEGGLNLLS